jgi:hypothetical protein
MMLLAIFFGAIFAAFLSLKDYLIPKNDDYDYS